MPEGVHAVFRSRLEVARAALASRSRSGTRLTRAGTEPARPPGNMIIHTHGTVP